MVSKNTTIKLKEMIAQAKDIAIISHIRPDGDTIGSSLCMYQLCKNMGKQVTLLCESKIPDSFEFLNGVGDYLNQSSQKFDLVFAMDCADVERMGVFKNTFFASNTTVNIDHHYANNNFGNFNQVHRTASSTCQVLFELLKECEIDIDKTMAQCLFCGLSTDTGHFMHSNVDGSVFAMASNLCELGVQNETVARNLYKKSTKQRLKLLAKCLTNMEYHFDDQVCIIALTKQDLQDCNATMEDTEGLVRYCVDQKTVKIGIMMTQHEGKAYKVSMRSHPETDVSLIASIFGGGGHKQASGCMIFGNKEFVIQKLLDNVREVVDCTL